MAKILRESSDPETFGRGAGYTLTHRWNTATAP